MSTTGRIFWIERFAVHDGPGIRVAVFLKGCPLRCVWCHSPESQSPKPELVIKADRCIVCGACAPRCAHDAIVATPDGFDTARDRCATCGDCADICPTSARSLVGRDLTVPELMREIEKDRIFFGDKGGVTFSGGEPLMQPTFLNAALTACRAAGVHTAVETSGFGARWAIDVAARADLVFFDLKLYDEARHIQATGVSNRRILRNFDRLTARHKAVRVRVPLVPGINDDQENLDAIGRLAASAGVRHVDLLPYHTAGVAKYARLGRPYELADVQTPSPETVAGAQRTLEQHGLAVHIGG